MLKLKPRFEIPEDTDDMKLAGWAWNSHFWEEGDFNVLTCKWCGQVWVSNNLPLNPNHHPLCKKNPKVVELLRPSQKNYTFVSDLPEGKILKPYDSYTLNSIPVTVETNHCGMPYPCTANGMLYGCATIRLNGQGMTVDARSGIPVEEISERFNNPKFDYDNRCAEKEK